MDNTEPKFFKKEYFFYGSHALKVKKLKSPFGEEVTINAEILLNAMIVGFLYNRKAPLDKSIDENTKVQGDKIFTMDQEMKFIFRIIMLLDEEYEPDKEKRIDKAFRYLGEDENDIKLVESYIRGGVDVLYEQLLENTQDKMGYVANLIDFVERVNTQFNSKIAEGRILQLCEEFNKAK